MAPAAEAAVVVVSEAHSLWRAAFRRRSRTRCPSKLHVAGRVECLYPSCPASRRKSITCSAPVSQSAIRGPATSWLYGWS